VRQFCKSAPGELARAASGETFADIAAAAGVSAQRIQQIAKEANGS